MRKQKQEMIDLESRRLSMENTTSFLKKVLLQFSRSSSNGRRKEQVRWRMS